MLNGAFFATLSKLEHITSAYWIASSALRGQLPTQDTDDRLLSASVREIVGLAKHSPYPRLRAAAIGAAEDLNLSVVAVSAFAAIVPATVLPPSDVEPA